MKPITFLSSPPLVLVLQQIVSTWFVYKYFLCRDSMTVNDIWNFGSRDVTNPHVTINNPIYGQIEHEINDFESRFCNNAATNKSEPIQKPYDKVILIVIDALGAKFIPSLEQDKPNQESKFRMPFVEQAIREKKALGFVAHAATPTVTMPRIKALITGTIPSFLDLIHNLARDVSKFEEENIVQIAINQNKSIVFYGDDTWIQLFDRREFLRYRETHSFMATDYTSVDNNVTQDALPETEREPIDWDMMILHYLGLDHIGHVFGSNEEPIIKDKLLEMDTVIQRLYNNMSKKNDKTLIVVCGDHGMSSEGNHGGASKLEAETAMIFLPINGNINLGDEPHQRYIQQIDLAVTLSRLWGIQVPTHSKGVLIESVVKSLPIGDRNRLLCMVMDNIKSLLNAADDNLLKSSEMEANQLVKHLKVLTDSYDNPKGLDLNIHIKACLSFCRHLQGQLLKIKFVETSDIGLVIMLTIMTIMSFLNLKRISISLLFPTLLTKVKLLYIATFVFPIILQGSTDYIEAEQYFWPYYSFIAFLLLTYMTIPNNLRLASQGRMDNFKITTLIIFYLITITWNQLAFLRSKDSIISYILLTLLPVYVLSESIRKNSDLKKLQQLPRILGLILAYLKWFELSSDQSSLDYIVMVQQVVLVIVLSFNLITVFNHLLSKGSQISTMAFKLSSGWLLVVYTLARPLNLFNFMSNVIMETNINYIANIMETPLIIRTLIYISFAYGAFFNQGNSNLFTSIDVRPAFYGQTSYSFGLSVILVTISTYSMQIYWLLKLFQRIQEKKQKSSDSWEFYAANLISLRNYLSLTYYMFVCLVLKNHLFIWSVISPKLVYHFVGNNIILLVIIFINSMTKLKEMINLKQELEANSKSRISVL